MIGCGGPCSCTDKKRRVLVLVSPDPDRSTRTSAGSTWSVTARFKCRRTPQTSHNGLECPAFQFDRSVLQVYESVKTQMLRPGISELDQYRTTGEDADDARRLSIGQPAYVSTRQTFHYSMRTNLSSKQKLRLHTA
jgi:hypothetical protein